MIFLLVVGTLFWSLFRYRAPPRRPEAAQIRGNTPLEIGWTVGAALDPRGPHRRHLRLPRRHREPARVRPERRCRPSQTQFASIDQPPPPAAAALPAHPGQRPAVPLALRLPRASARCSPTRTMVVPREHDRGARDHGLRRGPLVVDPEARRQGRRGAGLHERDLVQGPTEGRAPSRASAPSSAAPATRTCAPTVEAVTPDEYQAWADARSADDIEAGRQGAGRAAQAARRAEVSPSSGSRNRSTPRQVAAPEIIAPRPAGREPRGWLDWLTTTDHKKIGILYLFATVLFFFLVGGVEALLMRLQLGAAGQHVRRPRRPTTSSCTMHGTTMVFLFVVPVAGRLRQLPRAAHDRRARHGVPAAERAVVLAAAVRRHRASTRAIFFEPPQAGWTIVRAALRRRLPRRAAASTPGSS